MNRRKQMTSDVIELVEFGEAHLDGALALSIEAGWPHRREDWALVLSLGRGFVALDGNRVVGTAMMTPYGDTAATVNMVIVAEAMRGRGLGRRLMEAALAACGTRECRLTATRDGLPLYEKLGFRATHEIRQHQGEFVPSATTTLPAGADIAWIDRGRLEASELDALVASDRAAISMERRGLIAMLTALGRIAVLRRDGAVAGFAALRAFGRGEVVGPVVATSDADARALLTFAFAARSGRFLRVDAPEAVGLGPWLESLGLAHAGGGIAMTRPAGVSTPAKRADAPRGTVPTPFRTYALASQALG
ncbi:GNAT family N-acetyltransferase [Methyloraptor flagellatus]|uniref:GNAT family N-acetyltransferase n=2 Tax=Methyloraptor flagellatus TaxID=3162530 RepID=A0AAU7XH60_9HYPH